MSRRQKLAALAFGLLLLLCGGAALWLQLHDASTSQLPAPDDRAQRLTARRREQLDSYSWVDRDKQLIRIPIGRGMRLVVEGKR